MIKGSRLKRLTPFIDTQGILCVGGRLETAPAPLDTRHPIILPSEGNLTTLILRDIHQELAHASAEQTLHEARKTYWVIRGRPAAKKVVSKFFDFPILRAVHLEMAFFLDTDVFLSALLRFEQPRGTPAVYYSDNGTNFTGAQKELKDCLTRLDSSKIRDKPSSRRIEWHFNPPGAPHFGGAWESLINQPNVPSVGYLEIER